jgi:hypothetical protein
MSSRSSARPTTAKPQQAPAPIAPVGAHAQAQKPAIAAPPMQLQAQKKPAIAIPALGSVRDQINKLAQDENALKSKTTELVCMRTARSMRSFVLNILLIHDQSTTTEKRDGCLARQKRADQQRHPTNTSARRLARIVSEPRRSALARDTARRSRNFRGLKVSSKLHLGH